MAILAALGAGEITAQDISAAARTGLVLRGSETNPGMGGYHEKSISGVAKVLRSSVECFTVVAIRRLTSRIAEYWSVN